MEAAMKTAIRLAEFEDVLSARDVYSLIALAAFNCKHFGVCSRAFIKLETLPPGTWGEEELSALQSLAVQVFTQNPPYDPAPLAQEYARCLETGTPYHACTVTGRAVQESRTYMCRTCRHFAIEAELRHYKTCPLCHSNLH
jgi:WD repeat-containing protein 35